MAKYDMNYGNVYGGEKPQAPPSWGFIPASQQTISLTQSTIAPSSAYSLDSYPQGFTQAVPFKSPVEEAKDGLKKLEKKEKKKRQKRKDAKTAADTLLFLGLFNTVMWIIPIFGEGWHQRMFNGFGISFTRIRTSLFSITVDVECHHMEWPFGINSTKMAKLSPEHQVCKILSHMNGHHSLHSAKDLACAISHQACNIMESIWYSSFFLVFCFGVSALLSFLATLFLYYYWNQEHIKQVRDWAMGMFAFSPCFGILAFALYNLVCPDIGELPRTWTSTVNMVNGGTGLGEIRAIGGDSMYVRYGWCWWFSYITIAFSLAVPVVWGLWFKKHNDERQHELNATNEQLELEEAIQDIETKQDYVESGETYVPPCPSYTQQREFSKFGAAQHAQSLPNYTPPQYPGYQGNYYDGRYTAPQTGYPTPQSGLASHGATYGGGYGY
jgi:hypothetical protein